MQVPIHTYTVTVKLLKHVKENSCSCKKKCEFHPIRKKDGLLSFYSRCNHNLKFGCYSLWFLGDIMSQLHWIPQHCETSNHVFNENIIIPPRNATIGCYPYLKLLIFPHEWTLNIQVESSKVSNTAGARIQLTIIALHARLVRQSTRPR